MTMYSIKIAVRVLDWFANLLESKPNEVDEQLRRGIESVRLTRKLLYESTKHLA